LIEVTTWAGFIAVLKIETETVTSIAASLIGQAVILVIMYVKIFKIDIIVFICKVIV
jgi:hypothetical protein